MNVVETRCSPDGRRPCTEVTARLVAADRSRALDSDEAERARLAAELRDRARRIAEAHRAGAG